MDRPVRSGRMNRATRADDGGEVPSRGPGGGGGGRAGADVACGHRAGGPRQKEGPRIQSEMDEVRITRTSLCLRSIRESFTDNLLTHIREQARNGVE